MVQVLEKRSIKMNYVDVEQVNLEMHLEHLKNSKLTKPRQVERKPVKNRLSKLFKKAELNAKYPEELIPIHRLERQRVYRVYGVR